MKHTFFIISLDFRPVFYKGIGSKYIYADHISKWNQSEVPAFSHEDTDSYHSANDNFYKINKPLDRGPYFDTSATRNVTSLVGKTAHLNCRIKNLGNKTVRMPLA